MPIGEESTAEHCLVPRWILPLIFFKIDWTMFRISLPVPFTKARELKKKYAWIDGFFYENDLEIQQTHLSGT